MKTFLACGLDCKRIGKLALSDAPGSVSPICLTRVRGHCSLWDFLMVVGLLSINSSGSHGMDLAHVLLRKFGDKDPLCADVQL